ncbi:hypothetical protein EHW64_00535 [Erwinia psidii]|uniref:Uncharacterized protein n=1 Tax=Erwinia psidii TaxID=69224 RepID=A0A3N6SAB8_9GAMM|nr:hypothetical protein [Erwinia psidii]MCX8959712.1 hypothetical protein [Erwinia psidii]RQM38230.1 hypothetical protein EB241_10810 [Erwinia psidii]
MVKFLSVVWITDSDFPMSSITGRANLLLTTSTGGDVCLRIKMAIRRSELKPLVNIFRPLTISPILT